MASEKHNFIVSAIARKMRQDGFRIIYLDGEYHDETSEKLEIKIDLQKQIQNFKKLVINQLLKSCSRYVL